MKSQHRLLVMANKRSNEQLVKLIGLKQKKNPQSIDLSEDDKNSLFDMIQGEEGVS